MPVHPTRIPARAVRGARLLRVCLVAGCVLLSGLGVAKAQLVPTGDGALPNAPVASLDLQRYAGRWHEVARLPMHFQRKCVADVTAQYTVQGDGQIEVRNGCRRADGQRIEAVAQARPVDGQQGALKVRFAPSWLGWLPMVWADYWVLEIDPQYQWAMVGGPDRKYLWVLSRTPRMDPAVLDRLVAGARARGYPVQDMVRSEGGQPLLD